MKMMINLRYFRSNKHKMDIQLEKLCSINIFDNITALFMHTGEFNRFGRLNTYISLLQRVPTKISIAMFFNT